ncbi:flagellar filament capping protein FliD [Natroniella sp. ANB-PHB2]|uniref:flagellar filament capping protein FliD n=1 Tax=Natroniella sp. ANB-PHB2 TaxID=3384444 RepID=UPI0038D42145
MVMSAGGVGGNQEMEQQIQQIMMMEQQPIINMEQRQEEINEEIDALQEVNKHLDTFKHNATQINHDTFGNVAQSGNEEVVTATASDDADLGNYNIDVTQLAQVHREASDQQIGEVNTGGEITIEKLGNAGEEINVDVDVTDEDTVTSIDIANTINEAEDNDYVEASVVDDRIVIESLETGEDSQFNVTVDDIEVEGENEELVDLEFSNIQEGQDAEAEINGLGVSSNDNTLDNIVDGVTIDLEGTGETELVVDVDREGIQESIGEFVNDYNQLQDLIEEYGGEEGLLQGNSALRSIDTALHNAAISPLSEDYDSEYNSLSTVGIQVQDDGRLSTSSRSWGNDLDDVIENDLEALEELFAGEDGIVNRVEEQIDLATDRFDGYLNSRIDTLQGEVSRIDDNIETQFDRLEMQENRLRDQFTRMQQAIAEMEAQGQRLSAQGGAGGLGALL